MGIDVSTGGVCVKLCDCDPGPVVGSSDFTSGRAGEVAAGFVAGEAVPPPFAGRAGDLAVVDLPSADLPAGSRSYGSDIGTGVTFEGAEATAAAAAALADLASTDSNGGVFSHGVIACSFAMSSLLAGSGTSSCNASS